MWMKAQGYAVVTNADGSKTESDTCTCRHCNTVFAVGPKQRPEDIGGLCTVCMGLVCPKCVGQGCDEIQRKLDRWEASYHARRSYNTA